MIDWHSHVLPAVDDGSRSVEESLEMLKALKSQGVGHVIATPHFYANSESVDGFLERRTAAYSALSSRLNESYPRVLLGSEVRYYSGIGRLDGLDRLTVENTRLLLLEMPEEKWTDYTVKELVSLSNTSGLTVILAHIERYMPRQASGTLERLLECGILMQTNASALEGTFRGRYALKLIESGRIHFIGSDCHNMTSRPPRLDAAYAAVEKKLGAGRLFRMKKFGYSLLNLDAVAMRL